MRSLPIRSAVAGVGFALVAGCSPSSPETNNVNYEVITVTPSPTVTTEQTTPTPDSIAPSSAAPSQKPEAPQEPEVPKNKVAAFASFIIDSCAVSASPYAVKTDEGIVSFRVDAGKLLYGNDYESSAPRHSVCIQKEVTVIEAAYGGLAATFSHKAQNSTGLYNPIEDKLEKPLGLKLSLKNGTLIFKAPDSSVEFLECKSNLGHPTPNLEVAKLCKEGLNAQEVVAGLVAGTGNPLHDGIAKTSIQLLEKYVPKETSNTPFAVLDLSGIVTKNNS